MNTYCKTHTALNAARLKPFQLSVEDESDSDGNNIDAAAGAHAIDIACGRQSDRRISHTSSKKKARHASSSARSSNHIDGRQNDFGHNLDDKKNETFNNCSDDFTMNEGNAMKLTATSTPSNNLSAVKNELKMENSENQYSQQGSNYEIRQQEPLRSYNHDQHLQQQQNKKGPFKTASEVLSEHTAIIQSYQTQNNDAGLTNPSASFTHVSFPLESTEFPSSLPLSPPYSTPEAETVPQKPKPSTSKSSIECTINSDGSSSDEEVLHYKPFSMT